MATGAHMVIQQPGDILYISDSQGHIAAFRVLENGALTPMQMGVALEASVDRQTRAVPAPF